jgi:hypothetical protein
MRGETMNLWTIHEANGFFLTKGRVDHSKSIYYNDTPGVKEAYHTLWPRIGVPDGQIVWCYTRKEDMSKTGTPKTLWILDVPESSIITYIDDIMWNCILGIRVRLTPRYMRDIKAEASASFPDDSKKRHMHENKLTEQFWRQERSGEELWTKVFLDEMVDGSPALIKHPVEEDWIIDEQIYQGN